MELIPSPSRFFFLFHGTLILLALSANFCPSVLLAQERDGTISLGSVFSDNQTQRSPNGIFEVGLFSPLGSDLVYLGIWFADIMPRTVVWVANRANPTTRVDATFSLCTNGELVVFDAGRIVWSSGTAGLNVNVALLQNSGNFVLQTDTNSTTVWESFDQSGDTWLPTMKMKPGQKLKSWISSSEPAEGLYTFEMRPTGELVCEWNNYKQYWTSGKWNGHGFDEYLPDTAPITWSYHVPAEGLAPNISWSVSARVEGEQFSKARIVISYNGEVQHLMWSSKLGGWRSFWVEPRDVCQVYAYCGKNSVCKRGALNSTIRCECLSGFISMDGSVDAMGCIQPPSVSNCSNNGTDEEGGNFIAAKEKSLDVNFSMSERGIMEEGECGRACGKDCLCEGYYYDGRDGNCSLIRGGVYWEAGRWLGEGKFYVKVVANNDHGNVADDSSSGTSSTDSSTAVIRRNLVIRSLVVSVAGCYVLLLIFTFLVVLVRRNATTSAT